MVNPADFWNTQLQALRVPNLPIGPRWDLTKQFIVTTFNLIHAKGPHPRPATTILPHGVTLDLNENTYSLTFNLTLFEACSRVSAFVESIPTFYFCYAEPVPRIVRLSLLPEGNFLIEENKNNTPQLNEAQVNELNAFRDKVDRFKKWLRSSIYKLLTDQDFATDANIATFIALTEFYCFSENFATRFMTDIQHLHENRTERLAQLYLDATPPNHQAIFPLNADLTSFIASFELSKNRIATFPMLTNEAVYRQSIDELHQRFDINDPNLDKAAYLFEKDPINTTYMLALGADVVEIKDHLNVIDERLDALEENARETNIRLTNIETSVTILQESVTTLQENVATLQENVKILQENDQEILSALHELLEFNGLPRRRSLQ